MSPPAGAWRSLRPAQPLDGRRGEVSDMGQDAQLQERHVRLLVRRDDRDRTDCHVVDRRPGRQHRIRRRALPRRDGRPEGCPARLGPPSRPGRAACAVPSPTRSAGSSAPAASPLPQPSSGSCRLPATDLDAGSPGRQVDDHPVGKAPGQSVRGARLKISLGSRGHGRAARCCEGIERRRPRADPLRGPYVSCREVHLPSALVCSESPARRRRPLTPPLGWQRAAATPRLLEANRLSRARARAIRRSAWRPR